MSKPLAYSREIAAAMTTLSVPSIDRRIADGTIHAVKIGRRVVIPAAEVDRLLAGESVPGGDRSG